MQGLIHIYCGDGKGKTTAAIGLAIRCAGSGGRVLFFQFLKGNDSSERRILKRIPGIDVWDGLENMKFVWNMTDEEKQNAARFYREKFDKIKVTAQKYDMIILDEVAGALKYNFINEMDLLNFLHDKSQECEIVLTGRNPSKQLVDSADYVSEIKKIKHPFDSGINAREGIEY